VSPPTSILLRDIIPSTEGYCVSEKSYNAKPVRRLATPSRRQVLLAGASLAAMPLLAGLATNAQAEQTKELTPMRMEVSRNGSQPSAKGPATFFTGSAVVDPLYAANESTTSSGALVTFEPGARSAWHTHPAGQVLIVMSGTGWVQEEGGQKIEVKPGDVIWTPPGVKHWHGASATNSMSHITIANVVNGNNVNWLEHVTDEQYLG
jgi:quercetin dioxygenase-like cupin family protein